MILIRWIEMLFELREWFRERKAIDELHSMSDRELLDMGLNRNEIEFIIKHGR